MNKEREARKLEKEIKKFIKLYGQLDVPLKLGIIRLLNIEVLNEDGTERDNDFLSQDLLHSFSILKRESRTKILTLMYEAI